MTPQALAFQVDVVERLLEVTLPQVCNDIVLNYSDLFRLADAIGSKAMMMSNHVSLNGFDEAEVEQVRISRYDSKRVALRFKKPIRKLSWTKNVAMLMAEKMACVAESIAEQVQNKK